MIQICVLLLEKFTSKVLTFLKVDTEVICTLSVKTLLKCCPANASPKQHKRGSVFN